MVMFDTGGSRSVCFGVASSSVSLSGAGRRFLCSFSWSVSSDLGDGGGRLCVGSGVGVSVPVGVSCRRVSMAGVRGFCLFGDGVVVSVYGCCCGCVLSWVGSNRQWPLCAWWSRLWCVAAAAAAVLWAEVRWAYLLE
jgi:hypothetical protein